MRKLHSQSRKKENGETMLEILVETFELSRNDELSYISNPVNWIVL